MATYAEIQKGIDAAKATAANIQTGINTLNAPKPVSTTGVISSEQGAGIISDKTKTLGNLSTTPIAPTTGAGSVGYKPNEDPANASKSSKVTLLNPTTGQTSVFDDADINKQNIQNLMSAGYQVSETNGTLPTWLTSKTTGTDNTAEGKLQAEIDSYSNDIKTLSNDLSKYTVSDAQLAESVKAITAQFDARIQDMQRINEARKSSINTTGIRLGSQFAGGNGGVFGGIVSEEERQGITRIGALEAEKQSAIVAAKTAAQTQNWQVFSKQVDMAQKAYENKTAELEKLQKATADRNKQIADELKAVNEANAKVTAEKTKNINEVLTSARKNGAPIEVIQSIQDVIDNGGEITDAVVAAGTWGTEASGTLGEYYQYKRDGGAMLWKEYKNWDDNNKARVQAVISAAGLSKDQANKVAGLLDDYDRQMKDIRTVLTQSQNVDALAKTALSSNSDSGSRASAQMGLIFSYMKILDPSSTVREGEYATAQNTAGVADKVRNQYNKIIDGSFLTDNQVNGYKDTATSLAEVRRRNKEELDTEFDRRAALYGIPKGTITGNTSDKQLQSEQDSKTSVDEFLTSNPELVDTVTKFYEDPEITDSDVAEWIKLNYPNN